MPRVRTTTRALGALGMLAALFVSTLVAFAPAPAAAASGSCAGRLIDSWPVKAGNTKIGELVLYWDASTGRNCARMNHLGPTYGKPLRTTVWLAACRERSGSTCTAAPGSPAADNGTYAYYAGPVSVPSRNRCVHVAGDIYYQGVRRHVDSSPWLSHCS